jgi:hypothetical protein
MRTLTKNRPLLRFVWVLPLSRFVRFRPPRFLYRPMGEERTMMRGGIMVGWVGDGPPGVPRIMMTLYRGSGWDADCCRHYYCSLVACRTNKPPETKTMRKGDLAQKPRKERRFSLHLDHAERRRQNAKTNFLRLHLLDTETLLYFLYIFFRYLKASSVVLVQGFGNRNGERAPSCRISP